MQFINCIHLRKKDINANSDKIILVAKNPDGTKVNKIIEKPKFSYYITKPEYWDGEVVDYIDINKVNKFNCEYNNLYKSMAENINDKNVWNYYQDSCNSGDYYNRMKDMHIDYRYHGTDMNISDYYIDKFLTKYPTEDKNGKPQNYFGLTKSFFDIEVDSTDIVGFPDPEKAECPVNIISITDQKLNVYAFCLKYDTEQYKKFMGDKNSILEKIKIKYKYLEEKTKETINLIIKEYDDERELIKEFFDTINYIYKSDICTVWNMSFDFVYLYNRSERLGLDPNKVFSHKDFKYKFAKYDLDKRNQDPADRNDTYTVSSYTMYMDSMCLYANLSKMNGKKESYSLDYIGELETGMNKDKLEDSNIKTAHLDNYEQFFMYNIQDTIMLEEIERKTKNFDTIYSFALMTRTRIDKVLKKTISLRNFAAKFYEKNGYYISNNRSKLFPRTDEKISGAYVSDPNLNDNEGLIVSLEKSNMIFEYVVDFDASSLYPSIIITFNISPNVSYGNISLESINDVNLTDKFMDNLMSRNPIKFSMEWYNLPSVNDMYNLLLEKLN